MEDCECNNGRDCERKRFDLNRRKYMSPGFYDRLNKAFVNGGMSLTELSVKSGIPRNTLYYNMCGNSDPTLATLMKLSACLNVSIDYLIWGKGAEEIVSYRDSEMSLDEYQRLAARTINKGLCNKDKELHALHEMCGELGEIHSLYQKIYQGHEMDNDHLKKEIGDLMWGIAELCTAKGFSMNEIAEINIDKLKKRYPEGFSAENSLHRVENDI